MYTLPSFTTYYCHIVTSTEVTNKEINNGRRAEERMTKKKLEMEYDQRAKELQKKDQRAYHTPKVATTTTLVGVMQVWAVWCGTSNISNNNVCSDAIWEVNLKEGAAWIWLSALIFEPCAQHLLATIAHILFLLLYSFSCGRGRNYSNATAICSRKSEFYSKVSLGCCFYLLVVNFGVSVWGIVDVVRTGWSNVHIHLEALAMVQTITWIVIFQHMKNLRKPGLVKSLRFLQAWFVVAFLISLLSILPNLFLVMQKAPFIWGSWMDIASFPATLFLGMIGLSGKMEVEFVDNIFSEPLLSEEQIEIQAVTPYATAGIFSLATISWLNPLLAVGAMKDLELKDLPLLAPNYCAHKAYADFNGSWDSLKSRSPLQAPSLVLTMVQSFWREVAWNALFAFIEVFATYMGPFLIDDFVEYLGGRRRFANEGFILISIFFFAKIVETLVERQWYLGSQLLGLRTKAALTAVLFHKGLRLSSQSRRSHTTAEVINYMAVDVQCIADFTWSVNHIWMLPLQLSLALAVLYKVVGMAWVAALGAACLLLVLNTPLTKLLQKYQAKVMTAKDERMKATSECLRNMRVLKLQAWDDRYLEKLQELRITEYGWLLRHALLSASSVCMFWTAPVLVSTATFATCVLLGIPLSAGRILTALATFRVLQDPLDKFPEFISNLAQMKVSVERLWRFLQEPELSCDATIRIPSTMGDGGNQEMAIEIEGGEFSWDPTVQAHTLRRVNLHMRRGARVAVCGMVGSGKSSLLSCILGEIPKIAGTVKVCGSTAYVAQSAWIQSGKVEDNILFGSDMDHTRYQSVLEACALKKDLELFAFGDQTVIGERGINLSGGQKQRIQLARALYQNSDIYLLDDPFSAVDAHTGSHLFSECVLKALGSKTVVYVTHQLEFLPASDLILVLHNGEIVQAGNYDALLLAGTNFSTLVGAHHEAMISMAVGSSSEDNAEIDSMSGRNDTNGSGDTEILQQQSYLKKEMSGKDQVRKTKNTNREEILQELPTQQLVEEEEREKGKVSFSLYWSYLTAVYQGTLIVVILLSQTVFQVLQIGGNYWMAWASPTSVGGTSKITNTQLILVYAALAFGSSFFVIIRSLAVMIVGLHTAQKYFLAMAQCIFRAPMSFFDSTPMGRILNRASSDQSDLDWEVYYKFNSLAVTSLQLLGTIVVMSQVGWEVLVLFLPVFLACIFMQQYYIRSARELQRLKGIQQAPIIHHYGESIAGAATIRGYGQEKRFIATNLAHYDKYMRPSFYHLAAIQWLVFRMELLGILVFAFSMVLVVVIHSNTINPSLAGLAVTYGLSLSTLQSWWVWSLCDVQNKMIAVERIQQYMQIPSEAPLVIKDARPPQDWPSHGTIHLQDLQVRYSLHLPIVLHGITCTFWGGKKVGVVGRTGSGKSTLIQALFRMVEPVGGKIVIDGLDIASIGLHDLRSRLSIIPQDPTLFEGTMRANLDPLGEHSDAKVWEALDKCQLGDMVRATSKKLDSSVGENGENWSVGQRQLVCLGRALLKRTRILVLDEATASVDSATDRTIQRTLRAEFKACTVLTVAHRIPTVIDSDHVLVLQDGRMSEYDAPRELLEDKLSLFAKLVADYNSMHSISSDPSVVVPGSSELFDH